jgi:parallel beta-helix repeat protein
MKKRMMKIMYCLVLGGALLLLLPSMGLSQCNVYIGPTQYPNINTAIMNAEFVTISVTGTCIENVTFGSGRRYITLDGGGAATIEAPVAPAPAPAVLVRGDSITIKGFTIRGGATGVAVFKSGYAIIDGNTIESVKGNGIWLQNSGTARIVNSTIRHNAGDGINISENSSARIGILLPIDTVELPNTIEHNGGNGITVLNSSSALIVGNTIRKNGGDGIKVARVSQADISDNTIDDNNGNGIFVTQNSGVNLGNDTGDTIFDLPNTTTIENGLFGLKGTIGGYADGWLGTLDGLRGRVFFDLRSINSTRPWLW